MAEDLKAVARRTLEEILPSDVARLRAGMHPEVVNHGPPSARRRRLRHLQADIAAPDDAGRPGTGGECG
jgi:hypothetical protein